MSEFKKVFSSEKWLENLERTRQRLSVNKPYNSLLYASNLRHAAVLIILTIAGDEIQILFTHRTKEVNHHKDQVSLSGGEFEYDDKDLVTTAIRETREEIGVSFSRNEILGELSEIRTPSGFRISPFVGFKEKIVKFRINHNEVKNVFLIPLNWLSLRNNWKYKYINTSDNKRRRVIVFNDYYGEIVWGITAQIILNFVQVIK